MNISSRCLALVITILSSGLPLMAQVPQKRDATSILNNMFRVYSRLGSYQDEGLLVTTNDGPTGGTIEKMPFKTSFKRPNLFLFEWTDYTISKLGRTHVIWSNGKESFTYWEPDLYEKAESLSLAVAGATGITARTVNTVSDLLLPDELGPSTLKGLTKISILGDEVIEGVRCYHLKATAVDEPVELWIGKTDFLLRKFRRETKFSDTLRITEQLRRKIQVDHSLPELVFNYKPPIPLKPRKDTALDVDKMLNPGPPAWSEFRSEEGQFTVLMPGKPQSQSSTIETMQGRFDQHSFVASHDLIVYMVGYTDMPKQSLASNDAEGIFDGFRDQFLRQLGGKLASETPLTRDGYPGRDIKVHMFQGDLPLRLFLVGDRLFHLTVISPGKSDEESTNKFFTSFKLFSTTKRIAAVRRKISSFAACPAGLVCG